MWKLPGTSFTVKDPMSLQPYWFLKASLTISSCFIGFCSLNNQNDLLSRQFPFLSILHFQTDPMLGWWELITSSRSSEMISHGKLGNQMSILILGYFQAYVISYLVTSLSKLISAVYYGLIQLSNSLQMRYPISSTVKIDIIPPTLVDYERSLGTFLKMSKLRIFLPKLIALQCGKILAKQMMKHSILYLQTTHPQIITFFSLLSCQSISQPVQKLQFFSFCILTMPSCEEKQATRENSEMVNMDYQCFKCYFKTFYENYYNQIRSYYMQIETLYGLSRKSRGILFKLKDNLNKRRLTLNEHVLKQFQYLKGQFNKKEFTKLIKAYDDKLMLKELDQLFSQLDESCNEKVFLQRLKAAYESINEDDNPLKVNREVISRAATRHGSRHEMKQLMNILTQIRQVLTKSDEIIQIVHLFGMQNEGFLSESNVIDILNNMEYNNKKHRDIFLQSTFEGRQKISVQQFLSRLDLEEAPRRSSVSITLPQLHSNHELNQSQFIKSQIRQKKIEEQLSLSVRTVSDGNDYIQIQKIPEALKMYFNYGSELEPIFAHVTSEYIQKNLIFIDPENPPYSLAYQWVHLAQKVGQYYLFQMAKSVINRQKNRKGLAQLLEPKDIIQGNLGDCYFLSAVAGVVEKYPQLVYRLFVLQKNPSHIYGVRLFIEGAWKTVLLDACFPINRHGTFCGAQPHHQQIWVMLLQKAWAKVYGSYDNIHAGYNDEGLNAISGAPSILVSSQQNEFLRRVQIELKKGSIITCATSSYVSQMSKNEQDKWGIFSNHAYSLMNIYSGLRVAGQDLTLIKIRNPWGRKEWQGNWGFKSSSWTKQLRRQLEYESDPRDGSFFMSRQDFILYFQHIHICRVNLAYKNSWIEVENERDEFQAVKMVVKQKGDYFITAYQENPRRYSGRKYQKSKSWLFLLEEKQGRRVAVGSGSRDKRDLTIQASLQPGTYIIAAKVQWNLWPKHHFNITSYGPERVLFKNLANWQIHILSDFIESKTKLGFGKKSYYDNANIAKRIHFSPQEGYGFILITNQEHIIFEVNIKFQNHRGLTILPPYSLPVKLQVFPGEEVICKFLVDPTGYSYSLRENYKYKPVM